MSNTNERIIINLDGWLRVVSRVSAANHDIWAEMRRVNIDENNFTLLSDLIERLDQIETAINNYKAVVTQEVMNMRAAGNLMAARDQSDQLVFNNSSGG